MNYNEVFDALVSLIIPQFWQTSQLIASGYYDTTTAPSVREYFFHNFFVPLHACVTDGNSFALGGSGPRRLIPTAREHSFDLFIVHFTYAVTATHFFIYG